MHSEDWQGLTQLPHPRSRLPAHCVVITLVSSYNSFHICLLACLFSDSLVRMQVPQGQALDVAFALVLQVLPTVLGAF